MHLPDYIQMVSFLRCMILALSLHFWPRFSSVLTGLLRWAWTHRGVSLFSRLILFGSWSCPGCRLHWRSPFPWSNWPWFSSNRYDFDQMHHFDYYHHHKMDHQGRLLHSEYCQVRSRMGHRCQEYCQDRNRHLRLTKDHWNSGGLARWLPQSSTILESFKLCFGPLGQAIVVLVHPRGELGRFSVL